jgi:hypothetical protein
MGSRRLTEEKLQKFYMMSTSSLEERLLLAESVCDWAKTSDCVIGTLLAGAQNFNLSCAALARAQDYLRELVWEKSSEWVLVAEIIKNRKLGLAVKSAAEKLEDF